MKQTCSESVQAALSRLFDRYAAADIARAELDHFRITAPLGMSRERAATLLRQTELELERSAHTQLS